MTIMMDREAETESEDFTMEIDDDATDIDLMDLSDLMAPGCEDGNHLDAYTLETGSYSITQRCDSCGDTWTEDL